MAFSQVMALIRVGAAPTIPSISPHVHRIGAFLHKSSTGSCTERCASRESCWARGQRRSCGWAAPTVTVRPLLAVLRGRS